MLTMRNWTPQKRQHFYVCAASACVCTKETKGEKDAAILGGYTVYTVYGIQSI